MIFSYHDVTAFHQEPLTPLFLQRNITKTAETQPPSVRDVIIE